MQSAPLIAAFAAGLAGSVHCIGMCGGIVGALSAAPGGGRRVIPLRALPAAGPVRRLPLMLAYNGGRIGSYALAGAAAGGLAGAAGTLAHVAVAQQAAFWMVNLTLLVLGLYLLGALPALAHVEAAGQGVWRRLRPLAAPLLPMDTLGRAAALGALWGFLPCGMVYGMLLLALFSGTAVSGAALMAAFGLGTLPAMLGAGLLGDALRRAARRRTVRLLCGALLVGFACYGLLRAAGGVSPQALLALCLPGHRP
jgi:sulfite exporter TauE/SafE